MNSGPIDVYNPITMPETNLEITIVSNVGTSIRT